MEPTKDKLNIGSGKSTILYPELQNTHWNVDVRVYPGVDEVCDIRKTEYKNEVFTEILCSDVLDHFTFVEAKRLIRKMHGWLKPDGLLRIHTPNLRFLARKLSVDDNHEALKWLYATDGEGSTCYDSNLIRWAYSRESLSELLTANGFLIVSCSEDCLGYGLVVIAKKLCPSEIAAQEVDEY